MKSDMKSSTSLFLRDFVAYYEGGSADELKRHLERYDDDLAALERDFHNTLIDGRIIDDRMLEVSNKSSEEIQKGIRKILNSLSLHSEWEALDKNLSIYEFLLLLSRKGYAQTDYIIDLIDEKNDLKSLLFFFGGAVSVTLTGLMATPAAGVIKELITAIFSSVKAIPTIGLIISIGATIYGFYEIHQNGKITLASQLRDDVFLTLSSIAKITASILLISAAAVMSPSIAAIFVAASAIDVIKEIFCLIQENIPYKAGVDIDETATVLTVAQAQARHVYSSQKRMEAILINLVTAILIVGIMAVWCFLPASLTMTIGAIVAIGVVYAAKYAWLKFNESSLREDLQQHLNTLEELHVKEVGTANNLNQDLELAAPTPTVDQPNLAANQPDVEDKKAVVVQPETRVSAGKSRNTLFAVPHKDIPNKKESQRAEQYCVIL